MTASFESAWLALKNGDRDQARLILAALLRSNPKNELAWYWLATCVDSVQQKKDCLARVIALNPNNLQAKAALAQLEGNLPAPEHEVRTSPEADTQAMSKPANSTRPAEVKPPGEPGRVEKPRDRKGEMWVGIGTLLMLFCCAVLGLIGVYTMITTVNTLGDLPASDPTLFKKAAGKHQFIEVFADW